MTTAITINEGPTAAFTVSPPSGNVGENDFYFTDNSTSNPDDIVSWLYDLGDGSFIYSADGAHAYDPEGEYEVQLTVIDESGCRDTVTIVVPIYHGPLSAISIHP